MQSLTGLMADHLAPAKRAALRARPRIAILIPCLDEELTIGGVIEQFRKELPQAKIYVFDNNSTDHTVERARRSEEHTSELQSRGHLVCRLLLEKKKKIKKASKYKIK